MSEVAQRTDEAARLRLLLEQVHALSGHDFRDYALEKMRERVYGSMTAEAAASVEELRARVIGDAQAMARLVDRLSARPTVVFGDPSFSAALRRSVFPVLKTYPTARVWHAGCGLGGETYALAVLLREEGLLGRCRVYATDVSPRAVAAAKTGRFAADVIAAAEHGYAASGGRGRLEDHGSRDGAGFVFDEALRGRITFCEHSLATDGSFNEFQLIVARYALCQMNRSLQRRAFRLFDESLCMFGLLAGPKPETLPDSAFAAKLETLDRDNRIYRKAR